MRSAWLETTAGSQPKEDRTAMQFTATKRDFVRTLARVAAVAQAKSALPILANVLLHATSDGRVSMSATDLHVAITSCVAARVDTIGTLALPAKQLLSQNQPTL